MQQLSFFVVNVFSQKFPLTSTVYGRRVQIRVRAIPKVLVVTLEG